MEDKKPVPYLAKGMRKVETESSVLVSSSKYLNNARLRDWVATHFLRRNGADRPTPSDNVELKKALAEVRDPAHVQELFERERKVNPRLDRWLSERFISRYTPADLARYPRGSLGELFYRTVVQPGFDYNLEADADPKSHYDFFWTRHLQTHDLEHIVCGGPVDQMGEIVVHWANVTNYFEHVGAELASEMANKILFGTLRFVMRSMLHYPDTWQTVTSAMQRGIRVGKASDALFMLRYEDVFHLPVEEARSALGVRDLGPDFETAGASAIFTEAAVPPRDR
jgi:ubiquinone biosynthesis protein COQ4